MFTGIIEAIGTITQILKEKDNLTFTVASAISDALKVDQSVAHNGVCLTVTAVKENTHTISAIAETLQKTNLQNWKVNDSVNLERAMVLGARLDGHMVQGHVDATAICTQAQTLDGSWLYSFNFDKKFAALVIEKGSICINGTSLTCFNITDTSIQVAIIPYTFEHTIFKYLQVNDVVNIEFDLIGKYLQRSMGLK